jgi:intracellular multiplication protein IcmK
MTILLSTLGCYKVRPAVRLSVMALFITGMTPCFSDTQPVNTAGKQGVSSHQQALEQLRMLQQKMSPTTSRKASPSDRKQSQLDKAAGPTEMASTEGGSDDDADPSVGENEIVEKLAFEGLTQQLFPLSPDETRKVKEQYQSAEIAKQAPVGTPPTPTATSQFVNLSPGSTPPVIRLSQGFVSSLVFLDSTGSPWPISAYDLGDPSAFNIQWDKTSNTLMIQSTKLYTYGNLAVRLRDLNTPVMLTLIPGQKAVDYRVDLRVQGYGPNAKNIPMEEGIPAAANDVLLHILDGVPPDGSSRLTISGGDARGWMLNEKMFIRTSLTVLSPGWIGSMTSADGTHAYEMQKSPVLLVSWHGKVMQLKVEGL